MGGERKKDEADKQRDRFLEQFESFDDGPDDLTASDNLFDDSDEDKKEEKKGEEVKPAAEKPAVGDGKVEAPVDAPVDAPVRAATEIPIGASLTVAREKWNVAQVDRERGFVVLNQRGRGADWAVMGESATSETIARDYHKIDLPGGKPVYALKNDPYGSVYNIGEKPDANGKFSVYPNNELRIAPVDVIERMVRVGNALGTTPDAPGRVERKPEAKELPKVEIGGSSEKYAKGSAVVYDGEAWKVAAKIPGKDAALIHQPGRGMEWAVSSQNYTPDELAKQFQKVEVDGKSLYLGKGSTVYMEAPVKARDGKVALWPAHQYLVAPLSEIRDKADLEREAAKAPTPDGKKAEPAQKPVVPGEVFEVEGEKFKVAAVDNNGKYALIEEPSEGKPRIVTPSAAELAKDFESFKVGEKEFVKDLAGRVYEKTGKGNELKQVLDRSVLEVRAIQAARDDNPKAKELDRLLGRSEPYEFKPTEGERQIGDRKVKVSAPHAVMRRLEIDGKAYDFSGRAWFQHDFKTADNKSIPHGDVKIHVTGTSPADLAKVQAELIPELMRAGQPGGALHGKLGAFKTHDPMFMVEDGWEAKAPVNQDRSGKPPFMPGPEGQNAKGFTIYPRDAEAALEVRDYISKFLTDKKLRLEGEVKTGNVGDRSLDRDASNRVSLERDVVEIGYSKRAQGALLTPELNEGVKEFAEGKVSGKAPGWEAFKDKADLYTSPDSGELKPEVLKLLAKEFKFDPHHSELMYADPVEGESSRRLLMTSRDESKAYRTGFYLDESSAGKTVERGPDGEITKGLSGRPAFYEMSHMVSDATGKTLDPALLRVKQVGEINKMLSPYESAAMKALHGTVADALKLASVKVEGNDGVYKLKAPLRINFAEGPLNIAAIEVVNGEVYLKSADDGKRHRAQPWLDAIQDGLQERATERSREYSFKDQKAAGDALDLLRTNVEARVALVKHLAETYAANSPAETPGAKAGTAGVALNKGEAAKEALPERLRAGSAGGDIKPTAAGGYEVADKGREAPKTARAYDEIPKEELTRMREEIMKDKSGKMTPAQRADSLRVLELAEAGDVHAREAVRRALNEATKGTEGRFDKAAGRFVAIGMVAATLAGWYAYSRMQQVRPEAAPKAKIR